LFRRQKMRELIIVGTGSFFGGMSRFYLSGVVNRAFDPTKIPLGTIFVNFVGCFLIGILAGLFENNPSISNETKLFLTTGLLGGFTTFSAFGYETFALGKQGNYELALTNVALSLLVCLFSVWAGFKIGTYSSAL